MSTDLVQAQPRAAAAIGSRGILIADMDALARFAMCVHESGMAPKGFASPQAIGVAIQLGLELGLTPLTALQSIAVINGRPGIYGEAALALVRASGALEWIREELAGSGDGLTASCETKRRGDPKPRTNTFSLDDAKRAGLWGKAGPWTQYPKRMLMFRARGFNLRDNFPDVLKGFKTVEELRDYPDNDPAELPIQNEAVPSRSHQLAKRLESKAAAARQHVHPSALPAPTIPEDQETVAQPAPIADPPPAPEDPEAIEKEDAVLRLREQLRTAKDREAFIAWAASLNERAAWLGPEAVKSLREEYNAAYHAVYPPKTRSGRPAKDPAQLYERQPGEEG